MRLGGCNLACDFCDTEFENFTAMAVEAILDQVDELADDGRNLVVITGGEPLRQPIERFCAALLDEGYQVQIETNGTLWRALPDAVEVICSPKAGVGGYGKVREDLLLRVNGLKFIIKADDEVYSYVPSWADAMKDRVWVQAMDEYDASRNAMNLDYTLKLAAERGYKVSLQTHKLAGLA